MISRLVPRPAISRSQKTAALIVAALVDFVQLPGFAIFGEGAASPFEAALDLFAAVILTAICGFKWQLGLAFGVELLPVLDLFPTWTAVVLSLPVAEPVETGEPVEVMVKPPRQAHAHASVISEPQKRQDRDVVDVEVVAVPPVQRRPG